MSDEDHENGRSGETPEEGGTGGGPANLADLKELGRYKIIKELGRGAMGIVFEAVDPKIGRKVALKVLTSVPGITDSELEEFRSRFFREARTAGMLSHPNIVVIHDVDHDEELGISYMAMEFLKGQTLYDLLRSGVKFTREQAIDLCIQVAEGLDNAHRQGVIHRDVKPANLMLLEDGTVKITDFGIAKISTSNLTKTGQFLGTPNYMSPEQVIGHVIDGRSDLFGLGIILYELLTGEKPFMGSSLTTITYQIVNVDPIEPSKIQPGIPRVFDDIVSTLLRKAPDERYQTGKDVAEALRAAREQLGGGPPPQAATASVDATQIGAPDFVKNGTVAAPRPVKSSAAAAAGDEEGGLLAAIPNTRVLLGGIAAVFVIVAAVLVVIGLGGRGGAQPGGRAAQGGQLPGAGGSGPGPVDAAGGPATSPAVPPGEESSAPETPATTPPAEPPEPEAAAPAQPEPAAKPPAREPEPAPKPVEKPPAPEPEPRIVPRQAEPLPINSSKRPAPPVTAEVGISQVDLYLDHKLKSGTITVEVDGELLASHSFTADKKKGGSAQLSLEVEEGMHVVQCCLISEQMKEKKICGHQQHRFVMNTTATIRALHQKPPFQKNNKFSFKIE